MTYELSLGIHPSYRKDKGVYNDVPYQVKLPSKEEERNNFEQPKVRYLSVQEQISRIVPGTYFVMPLEPVIDFQQSLQEVYI